MRDATHILFRSLGDLVAPDCIPGANWQVEYHKGERGFPSALAWVLVPPDGACRPLLKFILVADDSRRQGAASALVEACRERWPAIELTGPISKGGAALRRKFVPPSTPEDVFTPALIAEALAGGVSREELEALARQGDDGLLPLVTGTYPGDSALSLDEGCGLSPPTDCGSCGEPLPEGNASGWCDTCDPK